MRGEEQLRLSRHRPTLRAVAPTPAATLLAVGGLAREPNHAGSLLLDLGLMPPGLRLRQWAPHVVEVVGQVFGLAVSSQEFDLFFCREFSLRGQDGRLGHSVVVVREAEEVVVGEEGGWFFRQQCGRAGVLQAGSVGRWDPARRGRGGGPSARVAEGRRD